MQITHHHLQPFNFTLTTNKYLQLRLNSHYEHLTSLVWVNIGWSRGRGFTMEIRRLHGVPQIHPETGNDMEQSASLSILQQGNTTIIMHYSKNQSLCTYGAIYKWKCLGKCLLVHRHWQKRLNTDDNLTTKFHYYFCLYLTKDSTNIHFMM